MVHRRVTRLSVSLVMWACPPSDNHAAAFRVLSRDAVHLMRPHLMRSHLIRTRDRCAVSALAPLALDGFRVAATIGGAGGHPVILPPLWRQNDKLLRGGGRGERRAHAGGDNRETGNRATRSRAAGQEHAAENRANRARKENPYYTKLKGFYTLFFPRDRSANTEGEKQGPIAARGNCIKTEFCLIGSTRRQGCFSRSAGGSAARTRSRRPPKRQQGRRKPTNRRAQRQPPRTRAAAAGQPRQPQQPESGGEWRGLRSDAPGLSRGFLAFHE